MLGLSTSAGRKDGSLRWRSVYLDVVLILSVFAISLGGVLLGEKIEAGQGFGYDGSEYANIAQHFETLIAERGLDSYRIQRILPPAIVHYALKLLGVPFTPPAIITASGFVNVAVLTISAAVWCQIANRININAYAKLIGFLGLFVNFAVLKMPSYYPVLTDHTAFMLGMVALYFYLIGSRTGLYAVIVAGAFTWPTVAYACVALVLFPYPRSRSSSDSSKDSGLISGYLEQHRQMNADHDQEAVFAGDADRWSLPNSVRPVRVLFVLAILEVIVGLLLGRGRIAPEALIFMAPTLLLLLWSAIEVRVRITLPPPNFWLSVAAAMFIGFAAIRFLRLDPAWFDTIEALVPLSIAFVMCYVFAGFFLLWNSPRLFSVPYWMHGFRPHVLFVVVGLLFGINILQSRLSGAEVPAQFVFRNLVLSAVQAPAIFLVAHVVYFGPIVIVTVLYWRQISELIRDYGGGLLLMTSLALVFSLMSESRISINFLPLFAMVSVGVLDRRGGLSAIKVVVFAVLAFFMSHVWLPINDNHGLFYFMNFGPWMERKAYMVFLTIAVLSTIFVYWLFKSRSNKPKIAAQEIQ